MDFKSATCSGACFDEATLEIAEPTDTFLDTSTLGKGEVWINGEPLGRFWNIGPQRTLYLPAPFLKKGKNEIVVFDLNGKPDRVLGFIAQPVFNDPAP